MLVGTQNTSKRHILSAINHLLTGSPPPLPPYAFRLTSLLPLLGAEFLCSPVGAAAILQKGRRYAAGLTTKGVRAFARSDITHAIMHFQRQ